MQMRVFPQQQQNECTFKDTQLLHKPFFFFKLVQRQATPSPLLTTTATTTTTRTMQKKKKKVINRHSTRAKQKRLHYCTFP